MRKSNYLKIDFRTIWTFAVVLYIICSTAFGAGQYSILNTLTLYTFLAVSCICILKGRYFKINACIVSLILLAVILFIGGFYSPVAQNEIDGLMYDYITMLIIVICVMQYINSIDDVFVILKAFFLAGCVLSIYVYLQYGSEFWSILQSNENAASNNIARVGAEINNTNSIGMCTAFSVIIGIYYLFFTELKKSYKIIILLLTAGCFIVSMSTGSKKALFSLIVGIGVQYLCSIIVNKNAIAKFKYIFVGSISIGALAYMIFNLKVFSGIASRVRNYLAFKSGIGGGSSDVQRAYLTKEGLLCWKEHPIFGEGTYASYNHFGGYSHNNIVELLMNNGLIGCVVFYFFILVLIIWVIKNSMALIKYNKIYAPIIAITACIVLCSTGFVYYYERYYMMLLAVAFVSVRGVVLNKFEDN